jgi:hypothetical protein
MIGPPTKERPMLTEGFTSRQVCHITDLPYGTLYEWIVTGLISPSLVKPQGYGKRLWWGFRDLVAIQTAQRLRAHGLSMQALRQVVKYIQEHLNIEQPLVTCYLVTDGDEVCMLDHQGLLALLKHPGQFLLMLDITQTASELEARVTPLPQVAPLGRPRGTRDTPLPKSGRRRAS